MKLSSLLILCSVFVYGCAGYKILAIFPMPTHSHYQVNSKIVNELARRGHDVTHVTPYPQRKSIKNLKEISLEDLVHTVNVQKKLYYELERQGISEMCQLIDTLGTILTEHTLKNTEVQRILRSKEKYDVVLMPQFITDGLLGVAHHLETPLVLVATMPLMPWANFYLAHSSPPSYFPNLLGTYTGHMNFWQRLINSFYDLYTITYHKWIILPKHRELVKKYIPGQPDLYNFLNNASLLLINSHMSSYEALPTVPNAVEIGGLHIQPPKQLPEDLQKFLDESVNGVVVFSMGSNLKSINLEPNTTHEIIKAFSKLKQNVLMKWESDYLSVLPQNVKVMKWLPQGDVLPHPNVKVFITHGGLLSIMESVYYGIPVIGIPIFCDQKMNMALAAYRKHGVVVPLSELKEETLLKALDQVLNDPKYRNNAQKRSKIMRDRPMKPSDTAMYWIEYVIRHDGASHLRHPGADLYWYQRNLLDVIGFVLVTILLSTFGIFFIFKQILGKFCYVQDRKKKND